MPDRNQTIAAILDIEWDMFSHVQNVGGQASCQSEKDDFLIMRKSQFALWSDETLESYLGDITKAREERRNLMSEKYGFMMASTFPEEFEQIRDQLPPVSAKSLAMIAEIVATNLEWKDELNATYPAIGSLGRPVHASEDRPGIPSLETYMTAELKTYSEATLALLHASTLKHREAGVNEATETLLTQVRLCGFPELDAAEAFHKSAAPLPPLH